MLGITLSLSSSFDAIEDISSNHDAHHVAERQSSQGPQASAQIPVSPPTSDAPPSRVKKLQAYIKGVVPRNQAELVSASKFVGVCAGAAAITTASAVLATPVMTTVMAGTAGTAILDAATLYATVPIIGNFLGLMMGQGGLLANVGTAAAMCGISFGLTSPMTRSGAIVGLFVAHAALGVALAPAVVAGLANVPTAAFIAAGVGTLGIASVFAHRILNQRMTWQMAGLATSIGLALGPMMAQIATGVASGIAVGTALSVMAFLSSVSALYTLYLYWPTFQSSATPMVDQYTLRDGAGTNRLDFRDEQKPTIFGLGSKLQQDVDAIRYMLDRGRPLGVRCLLMSGPAGTGKTASAQALANELGFDVVAPPSASFMHDEQPALRVSQLFEEAREACRRRKKPLLVFIDECEGIFASRDQYRGGSSDDRRSQAMLHTFLTHIEGIQRHHKDVSILLVAATNNIDILDPSLLQRFTRQLLVEAPSESHLKDMMSTIWRRAFAEAALSWPISNFCPNPEQIKRLSARAHALGWVGRDVNSMARQACSIMAANTRANPIGLGARSDYEAIEVAFDLVVEQNQRTRHIFERQQKVRATDA